MVNVQVRRQSISYKPLFNRRGFSLLEVLLAVTILVIGVVATVRVMSTGIYSDSTIDGHVIGLRLAQQKMEDVKNASSFSSITTGNYGVTRCTPSGGTFCSNIGSPFTNYDREVLITQNYNSQSGVTKATVNVYWLFKGREMSVSLSTLLTDLDAHYTG